MYCMGLVSCCGRAVETPRHLLVDCSVWERRTYFGATHALSSYKCNRVETIKTIWGRGKGAIDFLVERQHEITRPWEKKNQSKIMSYICTQWGIKVFHTMPTSHWNINRYEKTHTDFITSKSTVEIVFWVLVIWLFQLDCRWLVDYWLNLFFCLPKPG